MKTTNNSLKKSDNFDNYDNQKKVKKLNTDIDKNENKPIDRREGNIENQFRKFQQNMEEE